MDLSDNWRVCRNEGYKSCTHGIVVWDLYKAIVEQSVVQKRLGRLIDIKRESDSLNTHLVMELFAPQ